MGMRKTKERIRYSFYWPGLSQDVEIFCKTCKDCQLRSPEKKTDRIPITPVSRPDLPSQLKRQACCKSARGDFGAVNLRQVALCHDEFGGQPAHMR
ncbi:hypothetical protein AVEN_217414-1 [Araneus ventricosus]|uniref:Integrase zinc-binding domain-containing protein n=1 Tax=Araneus ventricosus TaxID=182803 RepID=A0A4Y2S8U5_ARAVE|nr:hypothetical protein AVEN_217414-1 [Araneus ventricosus]